MQGQITGEYRMKTKQWSKTGGNTPHQSPETLRKTGGGKRGTKGNRVLLYFHLRYRGWPIIKHVKYAGSVTVDWLQWLIIAGRGELLEQLANLWSILLLSFISRLKHALHEKLSCQHSVGHDQKSSLSAYWKAIFITAIV